MSLVVSCEHGGNKVPARWTAAMAGSARVRGTHRGYDPGALDVARRLARAFQAPLFVATTTRLLIDLNRSSGHPRLFSEFTRRLSSEDRRLLVDDVYVPFRRQVTDEITGLIDTGEPVAHISVHSFTPMLDGEKRNADIGLLYDPSRGRERALAHAWRDQLRACGVWRVRLNYPYRGTADGFVTHLRRRWPDECYAGIELELNQRLLQRNRFGTVADDAIAALEAPVANLHK